MVGAIVRIDDGIDPKRQVPARCIERIGQVVGQELGCEIKRLSVSRGAFEQTQGAVLQVGIQDLLLI